MKDTYDVLMHYGILGMKWGARRTPEELGHKPAKRKGKMNLKKKTSNQSNDISVDVKLVNDPDKPGRLMNCGPCMCALELRQRGYDVESIAREEGMAEEELRKYFKGVEVRDYEPVGRYMDFEDSFNDNFQGYKDWVYKNVDRLSKEIEREGPNARGYLCYFFGETAQSAHMINWATDDKGIVAYYDAQLGVSASKDEPEYLSMFISNQYYTWGRLDNLEIDESIMSVVQNRKR